MGIHVVPDFAATLTLRQQHHDALDGRRERRTRRAPTLREQCHELGPPRRQFSWTEWGLKGMSLTGVLAYADLAAGYFGYRFWTDLLAFDRPESFIRYDSATSRYTKGQPVSLAAYVNQAWDESINCSTFDSKLTPEVAAALARRAMTCATSYQSTLATLPDARLYVNPAHLRPAAGTPIHYTLK